jgi:hypothetical protein
MQMAGAEQSASDLQNSPQKPTLPDPRQIPPGAQSTAPHAAPGAAVPAVTHVR